MTYNPEKYWHERGANYIAPGEESEKPEVENLEIILRDLLSPVDLEGLGILEVGSGYGRIYNELLPIINNKRYDKEAISFTMCDFVESMRYKCLRNTDILPDYWDGNELPYNDNEFDLVISFSVLLHVPPENIEQVLKEHARVCNKYLFIATYFGGLDRLAEHCFEHNYKNLFEKLNLKIEDEKFFQSGLRVNWLLSE